MWDRAALRDLVRLFSPAARHEGSRDAQMRQPLGEVAFGQVIARVGEGCGFSHGIIPLPVTKGRSDTVGNAHIAQAQAL